jgi:hypothetical protein
MLHLFNNQVGFDAHTLGFPSVTGCNAIVYQTTQGLYGLHNYGGSGEDQREGRAMAFAQFVQKVSMTHATYARNLYSVINSTHRYTPGDLESKAKWEAELRTIALHLNFKGTLHLIGLQAHLINKATKGKDSVYIQFDRNAQANGCDIRYKKWSRMQETRTEDRPDNLEELKINSKLTVVKDDMAYRYYDLTKPTEVVESVDIANGKGNLRPVSAENAFIETINLKGSGWCTLI